MRAFLLLTLLVAPSAFASSFFLPGTQQSKLTLAANDAPACSRDVDCKGDRICQAGVCSEPAAGFIPAPMPQPSSAISPSTNLGALSAQLIDHQLQLLEFSKLSLAGPITTLVIAGAALVAGAVFLPFGYTVLVIGFSLMVGSALPLAIGLVWLISNLGYNARINVAINKLRDQRRALGGAPTSLLPAAEPEMFQLASF